LWLGGPGGGGVKGWRFSGFPPSPGPGFTHTCDARDDGADVARKEPASLCNNY